MREPLRAVLRRLSRRFWPGGGMARPVDWVESGCLIVVVFLGLLTVPVAGAVGSEVYATTIRLAEEQRVDKIPVSATLLDPAPTAEGDALGVSVRASWVGLDGLPAVGEITVREDAAAGDHVDIWLDRAGEVTLPPITPGGAMVAAIASAAMVLILGGVGLVLAFVLVRWLLDRHRLRRWEVEWARVQGKWTAKQE